MLRPGGVLDVAEGLSVLADKGFAVDLVAAVVAELGVDLEVADAAGAFLAADGG